LHYLRIITLGAIVRDIAQLCWFPLKAFNLSGQQLPFRQQAQMNRQQIAGETLGLGELDSVPSSIQLDKMDHRLHHNF
jgi:hypothetical protein